MEASQTLAGYTWKTRDPKKVYFPPKENIKSGDTFVLMEFEGIGPLLQYGMGGRSSHVVMAIWGSDENNKRDLYIVESRDGTDWPQNGVQRNLYSIWSKCVTEEEDNIAFLPLNSEMSKKFNEKKAWDYFNTVKGTPYGYPTVILTWIDTIKDNYPPLLDIDYSYSLLMLLEERGYKLVTEIMGEALNKRLGTQNLNYKDIAIEAFKQGKTIAQLLAVPELDGTIYSIGESNVCSELVAKLWKAGGLFGNFLVQGSEFTPKDIYQIKLFSDGKERQSICKENDPELDYCQVRGDVKMELQGFNSVEIYSHMNEKCESLPPLYIRTPLMC